MRDNKKASPFGRGGNACIDGEGKPVVKESRYSDEQKPLAEGEHRCALCSLSAALPSQALTRQDRVAAPSIRHASLASCWPLPQQLLPVSAAGGGRRRCSQRERLWQVGPLPTGRLRRNMAQKGGPCCRGQPLLDNALCQAAAGLDSRALQSTKQINFARPGET